MPTNNYIDIMEKNHMEIPWHDYTGDDSNTLIKESGLIEKASVIGRVGLIMLSCGTGAWRVRTSMNRLSKELHVTCKMMFYKLCTDNISNTGCNKRKKHFNWPASKKKCKTTTGKSCSIDFNCMFGLCHLF